MVENGYNTVCYGCGVCAIVCPKNIIAMKLSEDGFFVPFVEEKNKCIECGLCENVCSYVDTNIECSSEKVLVKGYSGVNKSDAIKRSSTSGGVCIEFAKLLLDKGHKACGVKYDSELQKAVHFVADNLNDYQKSKGSKYIQSYTFEGFHNLKKEGKYIVFGTPCQIDSLRRYVKVVKREGDFVFVDFFCHGVPSIHLWHKYLKRLEKTIPLDKNTSVLFRDKKFGWHNFTLGFYNDKNEYHFKQKCNDLFYNFFLGNYVLNKSCYTCKFRLDNSSADIRVGDFWGRKFDSVNEGVSCMLALTSIGEGMISELKSSCGIEEANLDDIFEGQMKTSYNVPGCRNIILYHLKGNGSLKSLYFFYGYKMWLKNMIPKGVKNILKNLLNR
jgi:coenzyme F420-reducing hydrogenase beta subunit